ncbi:hypothetical protein [Scleromatobacter humisilvae]|uniref:Uncharacterized protein n=1 Tax=Scleromatobacter humisilvae TaxID=2897159 RepID=A0A9X2C4I6_9BURK|nr:hypothetical protein [Scleromatobacter humisilvae]MCK9689705.1 hypothetical protein [Scleromatobacter humisilvae]
MASPDDTTVPGEDFIDTLAPAPPTAPRVDLRSQSDAPDRLVFFFSGFDPKSATFYHRLFRTGIAQRNAAHDETLALGKRHRIGRWASVWTALWRGASSALGGRPVAMRTRVHFMRWDDIVQRHWRRAPLTLARDYWNIYAGGLGSGVLRRIWRTAPAAFWLAMLPLIVCVLSFATGLLVIGGLLALSGLMSALPTAALGLVVGALLWRLMARRVDCEWLLRLYAFMRQQALGQVPALDARLDEMAAHMTEAVEARMRQPGAAPLREVLLVGYSSGSIMSAAVLARALPKLSEIIGNRRANKATTLAMVTLGHCIPIAAEWPGARRVRNDLEALAESPLLTWHDYSAASDHAAFWKAAPWPQPALLKGYQASPLFPTTSSAWQLAGTRRDRRETHLQYLRPPRARGDAGAYDFFTLACGPQTLAEQHARVGSTSDLREKTPS